MQVSGVVFGLQKTLFSSASKMSQLTYRVSLASWSIARVMISPLRNVCYALRCLAVVAAGLEVFLLMSQLPAHVNLSIWHILLNASGTPKIGGEGGGLCPKAINSESKVDKTRRCPCPRCRFVSVRSPVNASLRQSQAT